MRNNEENSLLLGTTEPFATMHKWLQRGLFICLVALVIEASFTLPGLLIWFGWPTLTITEVCHELMKVRWSNDDAECLIPHPLWGANEGTVYRNSSYDEWGIQPRPKYKAIHFRDLLRFRDERLKRESAAQAAAQAAGIDVTSEAVVSQ